MNITDLLISSEMLNDAILLNARDVYAYTNGQRTDKVEGVNFEILLSENGNYNKINVKVKNIFMKDIEKKLLFKKNISFTKLSLTVYPNYNSKDNSVTVRGEADDYYQNSKTENK